MRKTGITRRVDNLGRIVLPKEIRNNLRIKSGDTLEIFITDDEELILKKFSFIDKMTDLADSITKTISVILKVTAIIITNDKITSINGKHKKIGDNLDISNELSGLLSSINDMYIGKDILITQDKNITENFIIYPIIAAGDKIGTLLLLKEGEITEEDKIICKITTSFLGKYVE